MIIFVVPTIVGVLVLAFIVGYGLAQCNGSFGNNKQKARPPAI